MGNVSGSFLRILPTIEKLIEETILVETGISLASWKSIAKDSPATCPSLESAYNIRQTEPKLLADIPEMPDELTITNEVSKIQLPNILTTKKKTKIPFTFNLPTFQCCHETLNRTLLKDMISYIVSLGISLVDPNILKLLNLFLKGSTEEKVKQTNMFGDYFATETGK